jgi:hypothetical protein
MLGLYFWLFLSVDRIVRKQFQPIWQKPRFGCLLFIIFTLWKGMVYTMAQTKKISIERAKFPEQVGVSSKAIAAGAVYEGDFWDYYQGKAITEDLPVGTILTISVAGSEGSAGY